eukprot:3409807-Rhodomonas_salina.3
MSSWNRPRTDNNWATQMQLAARIAVSMQTQRVHSSGSMFSAFREMDKVVKAGAGGPEMH